MINKAGRAAVERLPNSIRIGGYDWAIEKWSSHQSASAQRYGECSIIEQTIRVQLDMPTRFKAVDTLMHEVMHAVFWVYGIHDDDKEERIVAALGSATMALHRDNPWLTKWIEKVLK